MNLLGITLTILVSIIVGVLIYLFIYEYIWNKRLNRYQEKNDLLLHRKRNHVVPLRRIMIGLTSVVVLSVFIVTGTFDLPKVYQEKNLINAKIAQNELAIRNKINEGSGFDFYGWFSSEAKGDFALDGLESGQSGENQRDVVGTNLQVEGVDEADIIKTDGYEIFYTPKYKTNQIYRFKVENDGSLTMLDGLIFEDTYIKEFYLTDEKLIVIGYKLEIVETYYASEDVALILPANYFHSYRYSSNIHIYDRTTLTLDYELQTFGDIQTHRLIDDTLYFVSYNRVSKDEIRPKFIENIGDNSKTSYVDYDSIILFDQIPAYQMVTITTLNTVTHKLNHETILGVADFIYMTKDALYLSGTFRYYPFMNTVVTGTHIVKFNLDTTKSTIHYAASTILQGYVGNQFWMDQYEGLLRVVTSRSWGASDKNRLYVLKENMENDTLDHFGLLEDGIGKPNERVMSARFDKHIAYVVTYEQKDPLYTIDMSNPKDIKIINDIEEPGYNTYLHVWGDNHLIGLGYDQNFGVKISAYQTTDTLKPLETYHLTNPDNNLPGWSYSDALHNHKAILVSPLHGFIGFAARNSVYDNVSKTYNYISSFYLFYIDFEGNPIIQDPYIIEHGITDYVNQVDRGIYINNLFYTFSSNAIVTFNGETKQVGTTYLLS